MPGTLTELVVTAPGGTFSVPTPPTDWYPPSLDDPTASHRVQVAVRGIRPRVWLGELIHASVEDGRHENLDGSAAMTVTVPVTDPSLALLTSDVEEWGKTTGRLDLIDRELYTVEDGKVTGCYLPRGQVSVRGETLTIECDGNLIDDRTMGRGESNDLLNGAGFFPDVEDPTDIEALGWEWFGDPDDIEVVPALRRPGGSALRIRGEKLDAGGTLDGDRLRIRKHMVMPSATTYHNLVRAVAFMNLPDVVSDGDILMEVEIHKVGVAGTYFPEPGEENTEAAYFEDGMLVEEWDRNPQTAVGRLPVGPYHVSVHVIIYPQSPTNWLYLDEVELIQRDNLASTGEIDLTDHHRLILQDCQNEAKGKTTWNKSVVRGDSCVIEERLVIWREDDQTAREVLEAVAGRSGGPDMPYLNAQGNWVVGFRRGSVRDDLVGPDRIVRVDGWQVNESARVSQVRAMSDFGDGYYRVGSIKTDLSQTSGHLIERVTRAPNDLGLRALDQWAQADLEERAQAQETCVVWLPIAFGWGFKVGDSFRLFYEAGGYPFGLRLDRTVRVIDRAFHDRKRLVALTVGTDDLELGRPAKPVGFGRMFGRDRHAIGQGLATTTGRMMRERRKPRKPYRPPTLGGLLEAESGELAPSSGSENIDLDVPSGSWAVAATHTLAQTGGTGTFYVSIYESFSPDLIKGSPYPNNGTAFVGGLVVHGPTTVNATAIIDMTGETVTARTISLRARRIA